MADEESIEDHSGKVGDLMKCQALDKETKERRFFNISSQGQTGVYIECPHGGKYYLIKDQVIQSLNLTSGITFQFKIFMRLLLNIARSVTRFPDELTLIERDYRRYLADRKL